MKYLRIQILRFFAAFAVVFFHAVGTSGTYFPGPTHLEIFNHADLGVDLFFVISGFIIFVTSQTREQRWTLFLRRRLERVVPLYWLATLTMAALLSVHIMARSDPPSLEYVVKSLFYISWTDGRLPVVYPGWTLEYELAFYLLATAWIAASSRPWGAVLVSLAALPVLGAIGRAMHVTSPQSDFLTNAMYLEFALGVLAGHVVLRKRPPLWPTVAVAASLLIITLLPWNESVWRVLAAGLVSGAAVLLASLWDRAGALKSKTLLVLARLGDSSYSIYLVQIFVISILCKLLHAATPHAARDLVVVIASFATLGVAYLVSQFIEFPIGRYLHRRDRGAVGASVRSPPGDGKSTERTSLMDPQPIGSGGEGGPIGAGEGARI